jgi:hypothetical protein
MNPAAAKDGLSKAVKMSASNPTRAFDPRTDLTPKETKVVREFVEKGNALDKPVSEFLAVAIKVKAIFAKKVRGIPVLFEGRYYLTFEKLVDGTFPRSSRTIRRWLAEEGITDQRFANKSKPGKPKGVASLPAARPSEEKEQTETASASTPLSPEAESRLRSAVGGAHGKGLAENLVKAYEAGYRHGYSDALTAATKRKAVA